MKNTPFLSKSKYVDGLKCLKLLWYEYNRREEIPETDDGTTALFEQGKAVGKLAHKLFPGGILLERDAEPEKQAEKSLKAASLGKPLFEAGFIFNRLYALADILLPVSGGVWDLIEVKSATSVKEVYCRDAAFQKHVYEGAGLRIRKCYIMYVNNQYVRQGDIDPERLLTKEDITRQVDAIIPSVEANAQQMLQAIREHTCPDIKIGQHCNSPYPCPLESVCRDFLPRDGNVLCLVSPGKRPYELIEKGIYSISDIPGDGGLNEKQKIQVECHKTGQPHINKGGIKQFLNTLKYPLYFLDFETIAPAIPAYDNSRPYETIPFQYSLHIVRKEGMEPEHHSYLAPGNKDPRPEILKRLKQLLGNSGSVIAYNAAFEKTAMRKAVEIYTEYREWLKLIEERVIDLLTPFRSFLYYHPCQEGSASIKNVLPAMTNSGYSYMEIAEGGTASIEYSRITFGEDVPEEERQRILSALEKYCALDTKGMIEIVDELRKLCR
ncbi:MAG: DUF2779 domain-containing protein [Candidatus Omnitrophica bacterium]|nr:DUF2779 domain-containing protein [Candidatus Omnitrophota bacterium]